MKMVKILRGLPGSGKSYWATNKEKTLPVHSVAVASADHFFQTVIGWEFNPLKLKEAHDSSLLKYLDFLKMSRDYIIVDNTNLSVWEIAPYYRLAEAFGYDVSIVEFKTPLEVCLARQTHGVPDTKMGMMYQKFLDERLPSFWKIEVVHHDAAAETLKKIFPEKYK